MGKRVSNKRGRHAGARSGRVRIGYHRQGRIGNVYRAMEAHRKKSIVDGIMDDESKGAMKSLEGLLMKLIPKRLERRGVR